jgi:squalene cyclase
MTTAEVLSAVVETRAFNEHHPFKKTIEYLLNSQLPDGSWSDPNDENPWDVSSTAWVIWSLTRLNDPSAKAACSNAVQWLSSLSLPSGGFPTNARQSVANTYATAYGLRALSADDRWMPITKSCINYLGVTQNSDGGWGLYAGDDSDPTLTAYSLHGLIDSGIGSADNIVARGVRYLLSSKNDNGSWRSWLGESESVEGAAFSLYILSKAGKALPIDSAKTVEYVSKRIAEGSAWQIDGVNQIWVAVSCLLMASIISSFVA